MSSHLSLALQFLWRSTGKTPRNFYSSNAASKKWKQAVVIKKLHKANKEIFGELLETKQEKLKKVKELAKIKKEAKKKAKTVVPTVSELSDQQIEDDLDPDPTNVGTKPESLRAVQSHYAIDPDSDIHQPFKNNQTPPGEISWILKNFPERARVISRFDPAVPLQTFETIRMGGIIVRKKDDARASQEFNVKDMNQVPTFDQLLTSLELTDVQPTCERKLIGTDKDSIETIETNNSAELEPVIDVAVSPEEINQLEGEVPRSELPKQETQPTKAENASKNLPSVSFDNPKRKPGSLAKSSNSQLKIISYQFNYKSQPSTRLPSVSKILQATMSPEQAQILEKWQQKMIAQLGEDGFKKYKDALFSNGKELHKNLQLVLSGTPREYLTIDDAIFGHWNSLQTLLPEVKDVHVLESMVSHPQLGYCGIVDCVALYRDKLVLIDWKTSEKKKSFISMTYDTPLQISAYIGALNHDPKYSFKVTSGLIVIAYQDGSCCQHFNLSPADLNKYWNEWLRRLNLYKKISATSTSTAA